MCIANLFRFGTDDLDLNSERKCNIYRHHRERPNRTWLLGLSAPKHEGIPENLLINLGGWFLLCILFIILRKTAWNYRYGRMSAEHQETESFENSCSVDYGSTDSVGHGTPDHDVSDSNQQTAEREDTSDKQTATAMETDGVAQTATDAAITEDDEPKTDHMKAPASKTRNDAPASSSAIKADNPSEISDTGYFSWIKIVLTLSDQKYRDTRGADTVTYLSFQRHLIVISLIITMCSLLIILPLNMYSDMTVKNSSGTEISEPSGDGFGRTTIANVTGDHFDFLWAHFVVSTVYLLVSIDIMRRFSKDIRFNEDSTSGSHTICVIGLNRTVCQEAIVRSQLLEAYPDVEVLEVSFAYNVSKLRKLELKRLRAASAKTYLEYQYRAAVKKKGEERAVRPMIRPYHCGMIGCCFICKCWGKLQCKKTDGINYYASLEENLALQVEEERRAALKKPLGIAYITLRTVEAAERIVDDCRSGRKSFSRTNFDQCWVKFAPAPEDINWHNLKRNSYLWFSRMIFVNLVVYIFVLIYSTPVSILGLWVPEFLDSTEGTDLWTRMRNSIVNTIPSIVLLVTGCTMVYIVDQSDSLIGFWTKTAENKSEMIKEYLFLLHMVVLIPAIGGHSIYQYVRGRHPDYECIFYKENGATFVKYVCTSSLCGAVAELLRIPSTFMYGVRILFARNVAEKNAVRKGMLIGFPIGHAYAWVILHFTIFTSFSAIYPLVTPFGLLYLIFKHFVDRYHIYFTYNPCKVEAKVHAIAVNLVFFSFFLLQCFLVIYRILMSNQLKYDDNVEVEYQGVFIVFSASLATATFFGQLCSQSIVDFTSGHRCRRALAPESHIVKVIQNCIATRNPPISRPKIVPETPESGPVSKEVEAGIYKDASETGGNTSHQDEETGKVVCIANNFTVSGKPYGRYIAPLLRPEFVRLAEEQPALPSTSLMDHPLENFVGGTR